MKKVLSASLALVLSVSLFGCSSSTASATAEATAGTEETASAASDLKIGIILVGDENEGYTAAHIDGIKEAAANLGIADDQIMWKYSIAETQDCKDAALDLVDQGATLVISNSYGHQTFMQEAASENPDVTFVSVTGDTAANSGLANFKNAFNLTYESRYVSGVVAGMKLQELIDNGTLTKETMPDAFEGDDIKIGYVGAYPYAEVVSGYTAFFLGIQSVVENIHMYVEYTNSWFDINKEAETANSLLAKGCVIIGQHADSTGAPSAVQAAFEQNGTVAYSVGYNVSMLSVAPDVALTSSSNNWATYYTYAFQSMIDGTEIAVDWAEGYETGAVSITELGTSVAEGTEAKVTEVETAIKDGTLNVFDTSKFTVDGANLTDDFELNLSFTDVPEIIKPISNGVFHESDTKDGFRSAPYFSVRIDGIEESGAN